MPRPWELGGAKTFEAYLRQGDQPGDVIAVVARAIADLRVHTHWQLPNSPNMIPNWTGAFEFTARATYHYGGMRQTVSLSVAAGIQPGIGVLQVKLRLTDGGYWDTHASIELAGVALSAMNNAIAANFGHYGWGIVEGAWFGNAIGEVPGPAPYPRIFPADAMSDPLRTRSYFIQVWGRTAGDLLATVERIAKSVVSLVDCSVDAADGTTLAMMSADAPVQMLVLARTESRHGGVFLQLSFVLPEGWLVYEPVIQARAAQAETILQALREVLNARFFECQNPGAPDDFFTAFATSVSYSRMFWDIAVDEMAGLLLAAFGDEWSFPDQQFGNPRAFVAVGHNVENETLHARVAVAACDGGTWVGLAIGDESAWTIATVRQPVEDALEWVRMAIGQRFPKATLQSTAYRWAANISGFPAEAAETALRSALMADWWMFPLRQSVAFPIISAGALRWPSFRLLAAFPSTADGGVYVSIVLHGPAYDESPGERPMARTYLLESDSSLVNLFGGADRVTQNRVLPFRLEDRFTHVDQSAQ